jgi:hypothetical protein
MTPGRDIRSYSRVFNAVTAFSTAASAGEANCGSSDTNGSGANAEHVPPTKLTVLPNEALSWVSTGPPGLPIVVVLLPANNNATG